MENLNTFIYQSDFFKKFQVDDLLFSEFKCPPDESKSGIWWHNNFFAYILSGETILKTPRQEYVLKPGGCFFAKKGSVLAMSHTDEDFCEILVFVPDDFIKSVIHKHKIRILSTESLSEFDTVFPLITDEVLLSYFNSLISYFRSKESPSEALIRLKFEELIIYITTNKKFSHLNSYLKELCSRSKPSIKEIMNHNFSSALSLNEFSILCDRSLSSFKREFRKLYGITPGKWLKTKRLEYSKYLIETTEMSIEEVCFESGFKNRSHFIKVFKETYGMTPGQLNEIN